MSQFENEPMPHDLEWRLVRAFTNRDKEEIKRLNDIWLLQKEGEA